MLLLVGLTGAHLDSRLLRRRSTTVVRVSLGGLMLPFGLGLAAGFLVPAALVKGDARMVEVLHRAVWGHLSAAAGTLVVPRGASQWRVPAYLADEIAEGKTDPAKAAARVSVVATIGYCAFLGGPPLIGFLGDHVTVLKALIAVAVLLSVAAAAAGAGAAGGAPSVTPSSAKSRS